MKKKNKQKFLWWFFIIVLAIVYILLETENLNVNTSPEVIQTVSIISTKPQAEIVQSSENWYEVYFTNPKIPFDKVYEGGIEKYLIQKIDASEESIDLAVFEFNIDSVAQALIRAKNRGVNVRVVYDNEHTAEYPQMDDLISAGIKAVPDSRSAYMHNKFFIFDNGCIWTGSLNISMNAAYKNNENALYFCSKQAAENYNVEFSEMFDGQFGSTSPSNTPYPKFLINNIVIENYFASEDKVMEKVINTVSKANSSIHFMTFSFTDDSLGQAMVDAAKKGVIVEGIFETTGADTQYSECKTLLINGFDIRLDGNPATFHHKVIIVDEKIVITGSFNFSNNANTQNDENLLIIYDPMLASDYEQQYQLMKQLSVKPTGNICKK